MKSLTEWLRSGEYLPLPLRDFHDQKEVFKSIWQRLLKRFDADPSTKAYLGGMTWTSAQIFVIDHFLWFMAAHGWTLQRSRARIADCFDDLDGTVKLRRDAEAEAFRKMLDDEAAALADQCMSKAEVST